MKRSIAMGQLLETGSVIVRSMDDVISLQDESVLAGILVDYVEVLVIDSKNAYKVYQLGGEF